MAATRHVIRARIKKEAGARPNKRTWWAAVPVLTLGALVAGGGCYHTPVDTSEYAEGPVPLRRPSPAKDGECCYEDALTGGKIFDMYCSYCHNAPSLAERNFANYRNVAAHMRVRANLTGKEYAKLMEFLRQWHDVPPPTPPLETPPKRFFFSQPIQELRPQGAAAGAAPAPAADAKQSQGPSADQAAPAGNS
jgi:hypothetical protein